MSDGIGIGHNSRGLVDGLEEAEKRSAMFETKKSLLKRAFENFDGARVILLIQWRTAAVRHQCAGAAEAIARFEEENFGQPRGVKMLNINAEREGSKMRYSDTRLALMPPTSKSPN